MTDFFGIGNAVESLFNVYRMSSRASGRTTSLIESVKDGDRIVFSIRDERDRVERLLRDRGIDVECLYISPKDPDKIFRYASSEGRTIFDHNWVEEFFLNAILDAKNSIRFFERESSGYSEPHKITKRKALCLAAGKRGKKKAEK